MERSARRIMNDLAKGAALLMLRPDPLQKLVTLVNPVDWEDLAGMYTQSVGEEIRRIDAGREGFIHQLTDFGLTRVMVRGFLGILDAGQQDLLQSSDPTLGDLLDGHLTTVKEYLRKYIDCKAVHSVRMRPYRIAHPSV
jgi:hypothetical protein